MSKGIREIYKTHPELLESSAIELEIIKPGKLFKYYGCEK